MTGSVFVFISIGLVVFFYFYGHRKGLIKSGHMCKTDPIAPGVRYQAVQLKYVDVSCLTCFQLIPAQILVKRTFKEAAKLEPYTVELDLTDYKIHVLEHEAQKPIEP